MHRDLLETTILPFGISTGHSILQRIMQDLSAELKGVVVYLYDILIRGEAAQMMLRIQEADLKLMS